ncbi:hypothetical protein HanPSC8_Chr07g0277711 [Helianthus annuus]|nr:hypothetical protein HanPSC8_Chr07g0277711 [Helianthus annuus]
MEQKWNIPANCQIWHDRANSSHDRARPTNVGTLISIISQPAQSSIISDPHDGASTKHDRARSKTASDQLISEITPVIVDNSSIRTIMPWAGTVVPPRKSLSGSFQEMVANKVDRRKVTLTLAMHDRAKRWHGRAKRATVYIQVSSSSARELEHLGKVFSKNSGLGSLLEPRRSFEEDLIIEDSLIYHFNLVFKLG